MRRQLSLSHKAPSNKELNTLVTSPPEVTSNAYVREEDDDNEKKNDVGEWSGQLNLYQFLALIFIFLCCFALSRTVFHPFNSGNAMMSKGDLKSLTTNLLPDRSAKDLLHPPTWIAGMVLDTDEINPYTWDYLIKLNCDHNLGVHIVVKEGAEEGQAQVTELKTNYLASGETSITACPTPFIIFEQEKEEPQYGPDGKKLTKNRVDRIAKLRDFQRATLKAILEEGGNLDIGVIMIADFDLTMLPPVPRLLKQVRDLRRFSYPHDAVCALGTVLLKQKVDFKDQEDKKLLQEKQMATRKVKAMQKIVKVLSKNEVEIVPKREEEEEDIPLKSFRSKIIPHYYDIFATIFKPDTFAYPYAGRLIPKPYKGEDPKLVRSDDEHGKNTQADIYNYLIKEARETSSTGNLSVRSCFGGFAMYRAKAYFDPKCGYQLRMSEDEIKRLDQGEFVSPLMRYANIDDRRPCEHVVLHDCLGESNPNFSIAVNPKLPSIWSFDDKMATSRTEVNAHFET